MEEKMTLYQIDSEIAAILDEITDEDGVINEEAEKRLAELDEARPVKVENCALFIKNRRAMASAIRHEENALAARRKRYEADAERVERILANSLKGERYESPRVLISWRTSQAVEVTEGAEMYWDDDTCSRYLVYTHRVDKKALAEALKKGEEIEGATLVTRNNMRIEGVD